MSPRSSRSQQGKRHSKPRGPAKRQSARPAFLSSDEDLRLQKFLANAGVDSRRNCEDLIRDGRVTVDGKVVTDPAHSVNPQQQDVRADGERLRLPAFKYFLLNKPKGVLCTNRDPRGRPRAVDLVPGRDHRLFTVGRLDENTQGLLLITNDGGLAEHLAHPRYEVVRRYRAQVVGIPTPETIAELEKGMHFSDGFFRFQSIRLMKRKGRSTFLELELREGKNREIRRLLARSGHKVINLERIAFGPLRIGYLAVGQCRELRAEEVRSLYAFVEETQSRSAGKRPRRRQNPKPSGRSSSARTNSSSGKPASQKSTRHKPASGKPAGKKPTGQKRTVGRKKVSSRKPASGGRPVSEGRGKDRAKRK
ncbi:MAG: rRNA pseudouridine synthase [Fuerstiella sp.]|nr:rRNA pseudouridine synthase [Fuerstiella sp.]MCP4853302.1 rRNA pseudouridine synthase [Fuerstiella sp.]